MNSFDIFTQIEDVAEMPIELILEEILKEEAEQWVGKTIAKIIILSHTRKWVNQIGVKGIKKKEVIGEELTQEQGERIGRNTRERSERNETIIIMMTIMIMTNS